MLSIRPDKEGVCQARPNQPGIDQFVSRIDVGQEPIATIGFLLIEFQSDFSPLDKRLVELFGLQVEWLLIFGRVDTQIPNRSAIFEQNGISVVDPLDSDQFLGGDWSG